MGDPAAQARKVEEVLPPVYEELMDRLDDLGAEDCPELEEAVTGALARAFLEGAHYGGVDITAQMIEQGVNAHINRLGSPET